MLSYQLDQLCTAPTQNSDQREPWFSGDPYIFNFDYQVNTQKEYFVKVKWVIANGPNFGNYILNSDATHIYSFDNYEYAKKISQLTNSTLDDNNNSIIDSYELQVNFPPNKPTNPAPTNGATNQFTNSDLTWTCTDPENDQLTYDIYLGTSSTPPLVKSDNASLSYDPGLLNQNSTYYWQIIVKDNKGNSTTGDIWNFSTSSGTNNQAPNEPSNPNPINNATYQSTSPTLSWDCSDPDGDPISYDVWLSTSNPPNVKVSSLQTEKSYNASGLNYNSNYYWQIFAKDDQGNITNGPVWKFTTTNSDVLPFNEGFESGGFNYGNWESYGTVQISSNSPYQGIYALSGGAGNWYISRSFGNLLEQSTIRSSTMIKISSVDNLLPSFQINFFSDYAYHSAIGVLFGGGGIGFSSNDIITIDANVGSGEKIGEFSTNQWFKVDIVFNLQNKLFDIYLDDILIADDFGMTDNSPTYFSIGTESNISVTKVDDILIEKLNNSSPAQPSNPIPANNETNQLP
ncbi:MAG: fibronectin type III domain-containing protein [Ignavibacteriales bacterium]|nr:fibronectin type III domain-containing protein [Ignavibacteriales bacterium]